MPVNPYFNNQNHRGEQTILQSLTAEYIQATGMNTYYLPRKKLYTDDVMNEFMGSYFDNAYLIEMRMASVDGFEGERDVLAQFGIEIKDQATFEVSVQTFENLVHTLDRPQEGDLIFLPMYFGRSAGEERGVIFEIHFVEDEEPFYPAGKNTMYKLTCELFNYSGEKFMTGIDEIDDIERLNAYALEITLDTAYSSNTDYIIGETVTIDSITATVSKWNASGKVLTIQSPTGNIVTNANVVGSVTDTDYTILSYDSFYRPNEGDAQNEDFEEDFDSDLHIEGFDEDNPFGDF